MRLLIDAIMVIMLTGVLTGVLVYQYAEQHRVDRIEAVQRAMRAIESESLYRAALGEVDATPRGFAREVRAAWFEHLPQNLFIDDREPLPHWLEHITDETRRNMDNPRQIVADEQHPPFWYNPYSGTVRARVPMQFSRRATVELYNLINDTALKRDQVRWPGDRGDNARLVNATTAGVGR